MIEDDRWKSEDISLIIYDVTGRCIRNFPISNFQFPIRVSWDGRNNAGEKVTSGVYLLKFNAGEYEETRQLLMIN